MNILYMIKTPAPYGLDLEDILIIQHLAISGILAANVSDTVFHGISFPHITLFLYSRCTVNNKSLFYLLCFIR